MNSHNAACLLAAFWFLSPHASCEVLLQHGGWVDIKPTLQSNVIAFSSNDRNLLIAFRAHQATEVVLLNESLAEIMRWSVPGAREFAALTQSGTVVLAELRVSGGEARHTMCRYSFDGHSIGSCVSGLGIAQRLLTLGNRDVLVNSTQIYEADWNNAKTLSINLDSLATDVLPLSVAIGPVLARVDPLSGQALLTGPRQSGARQIRLTTPDLAKASPTRRPQELLIWQLLSWDNSEVWLVPARVDLYKGLSIARFDVDGRLLGGFAVEIPVFDELKRPRTPGTQLANPTGHLVTSFLAATKNRLVALDPIARRAVWYDLSQLR